MKQSRTQKHVRRESTGRPHDAATARDGKSAWRTPQRHASDRSQARLRQILNKQQRILRPSELAAYLSAALQHDPELVAYLALGAFAGLRDREMQGLIWSMIEPDEIQVPKAYSKSRSARIIPVNPALRSWLTAIPRGRSWEPAVPNDFRKRVQDLRRQLASTHAKPALPWAADCLRHSHLNYRFFEAGMTGKRPAISPRKSARAMADHLDFAAYWSIRPAASTTQERI